MQYIQANHGIVAGDDPVLDTTEAENDRELKRAAEKRTLHRMAKVHNIVEMWQGSPNLRATSKKSCTQEDQMTAIGYILNNEEIINATWTNFQHDGAAASTLIERSPQPPALSARDVLVGRTDILYVC
jgi:hypothetical protein